MPDNFLALAGDISTREFARVLILPIPFEATVSYGHGTAHGPEAIIAASQQVELYDREFDSEPAVIYGIHTRPPLELPADPALAMEAITKAVAALAQSGKLLVGLGGEHSVSIGYGRGLLQAHDGPITVVQIDAHCDLRDEYEGTPYSHACVARRLSEHPQVEQILQIGIRSIATEEIEFARQHKEQIRIWYVEEIHEGDWRDELKQRLAGRDVYLTLDVDALDPALVPATGTPEPDGLTWSQTLEILRTVTQSARIVGMDCVELAPAAGLHGADYTVAKLLYKAISYTMNYGQGDENTDYGIC